MAITHADHPLGRTRTIEALTELGHSGALTGHFAKFRRVDGVSDGHGIYRTHGADLAHAEFLGWRFFLLHGSRVVGAAEVRLHCGALRFTGISTGVQVNRSAAALRHATRTAGGRDTDLEFRHLYLSQGRSAAWVAGPGGFCIDLQRKRPRSVAPTKFLMDTLGEHPLPAVLAGRPLRRRSTRTAVDGTPPVTKVLNMLMQNQLEANWCVGANSSSNYQYFTGNVTTWTQCKVMGTNLGVPGCCGDPTTCDTGIKTSDGMKTVGVWVSTQNGKLSYADMKAQINADKPLPSAIGWNAPATGGHSLCIYGYTDPQVLYIADPWGDYGYAAVNYADFPGTYHGGATLRYSVYTKSP